MTGRVLRITTYTMQAKAFALDQSGRLEVELPQCETHSF
jgi:hypothetical protein